MKEIIVIFVLMVSNILNMTLQVLAYNGEDTVNIPLVGERAADITAPEINTSSLSVSSKSVGIGEVVKVSLAVEDAQSDISHVSIYYQMPQTKRHEWVILRYNKTSQLYEGYINITEKTEDGIWKIDYIDARDEVGNSQSVYNIKVNSYNGTEDLSHGDFEVRGTSPDITAPEINTSNLSVSSKSVGIGEVVKVSLAVEDAQSDISHVSIYYQMPQTKRHEWVILRYNKTSQLYEGYINITEKTEDGIWKIDYIDARDEVGNSQSVYNIKVNSYNGTEDLSHGDFEVIHDLKERPFPDVEVGKWYTSHIQDFTTLGYINGYSDGMFKPQNSITRAEFVKIVNKSFGLADQYKPVTNLPFTDLDSQWKKDELRLALAAGYITPATEFRHNEPINRQEAAKIVGYLLGDKLQSGLTLEFTDKDEIATWAQDYVAGLVQAGVLSKNEMFRPKDSITRAEAVKRLNIARGL